MYELHLVQYIQMLAFVLLCFNKVTRLVALIFILSYAIYIPFILPLEGSIYYNWAATKDVAVGFLVISAFRAVGILSLSFVPINTFGYWLYESYYDPIIYDTICLSIIFVQIILLIKGAMIDGGNQYDRKHFMVRIISGYFDKHRKSTHQNP